MGSNPMAGTNKGKTMITVQQLLDWLEKNKVDPKSEIVFDNYYDNPNTDIELDVMTYMDYRVRLSERR